MNMIRSSLASALALLFSISVQAGNTIYVSPAGNDKASGDAGHPLSSLEAALSLARSYGSLTEIRMEEGTYLLSGPIVLDSEDSHLSIIGAGMGRTIISGGLKLPAFKDEGNGFWSIDMRRLMPGGGDIRQLFINGRRATFARTPDEMEYFDSGNCTETVLDEVPTGGSPRQGYAVQTMSVNDDAAKILDSVTDSSYPDITISFLHAWDVTRRPLLSYDPEKRLAYVGGKKMQPWNIIAREGCSQFYLEGNFSFLDKPGEFFYDKESTKIYYKPLDGEKPEGCEAVIPTARQLLIIKGNESSLVEDITVRDLSLLFTRLPETWRGFDPEQAAAGTDACVMMDFASGINIENCEISHSGNNAIWFRKACSDCSITHSYLHDIGIGAVKIGDRAIPEDERFLTRRITVDNNILKEGSRVLPTGVGVCLFQASDCNITHNEVADFYYSGMSIGWRWGYEHSPSKRNKINYNHIHHIGWGILSDMGGVYTLGPSEGTEVNFNVIHDIYAFGYGGWGLYTDEGSTGITMEGNLVYGCKSSAFHQHYGKDNHICNNLFVNQIRAQMEATRIEDHISFTFDRNIICYEDGQMYGMQWKGVNSICDKNIYWHYGKDVTFNGETLKEWQESSGKDRHSLIADPGIRHGADYRDWSVSNRKITKKTGFVQPDWNKAGVYGDTGWMSLAEFDSKRAASYDRIVKAYEKRQTSL